MGAASMVVVQSMEALLAAEDEGKKAKDALKSQLDIPSDLDEKVNLLVWAKLQTKPCPSYNEMEEMLYDEFDEQTRNDHLNLKWVYFRDRLERVGRPTFVLTGSNLA